MARVKRGVKKRKRKKKIIKAAKGFKWRRKSNYKAAKQAVIKAWSYQYRDRRIKKRNMRRKWQDIINQNLRDNYDWSYSRFVNSLKKNNIELDRKILAELAANHQDIFKQIIAQIKK